MLRRAHERVPKRLRLPLRLNGTGLIGVDSIGAAAFVGSVVASCEADKVLARNIGGLERFARPARLLLQARLAPLGATKTNELLKLPLSGDLDLFDPSRYVEQDLVLDEELPEARLKWSTQGKATARGLNSQCVYDVYSDTVKYTYRK